MDGQHLDEIYELYLLGTLAGEGGADVGEHLRRGCASCLDRLREAALTVYLLCQMTPTARPDPKLKSRLLRRLRKKSRPLSQKR